MKIIFFGTSSYCIPIVDTLQKKFQLVAVISKSDSSVFKFSQSHNISIFTPKDKKELLSLKNNIKQLQPDLALVADYGLIIPKSIFNIPRYKTLNIHFSKLPKLRGPSPVQYTILMGEKSAWISAIIMDESLDTGDIVWQKEMSLVGNETADGLYKKLFNIVASDLPDIINQYVQKELKPQKQDHSKATYTKHFSRDDGYIPLIILKNAMSGTPVSAKELNRWPLFTKIPQPTTDNRQPTTIIENAVRALSPWPEVWTKIKLCNNSMTNRGDRLHLSSEDNKLLKRLKILKAHVESLTTNNQQLITKLVPDLVQLEGKKPVSFRQFNEGYPNALF